MLAEGTADNVARELGEEGADSAASCWQRDGRQCDESVDRRTRDNVAMG